MKTYDRQSVYAQNKIDQQPNQDSRKRRKIYARRGQSAISFCKENQLHILQHLKATTAEY